MLGCVREKTGRAVKNWMRQFIGRDGVIVGNSEVK